MHGALAHKFNVLLLVLAQVADHIDHAFRQLAQFSVVFLGRPAP
jgi:hypothetical protein